MQAFRHAPVASMGSAIRTKSSADISLGSLFKYGFACTHMTLVEILIMHLDTYLLASTLVHLPPPSKTIAEWHTKHAHDMSWSAQEHLTCRVSSSRA